MLYKYLLSGLTFLVLDAVWITFFAQPLYQKTLMGLMANRGGADFAIAAILAYGLLLLGLYAIVLPSQNPVWMGVILGLVVYGVYGLTCYLVVDAWTWQLVLADWVWGAIIYGLSASVFVLLP